MKSLATKVSEGLYDDVLRPEDLIFVIDAEAASWKPLLAGEMLEENSGERTEEGELFGFMFVGVAWPHPRPATLVAALDLLVSLYKRGLFTYLKRPASKSSRSKKLLLSNWLYLCFVKPLLILDNSLSFNRPA